MTTLDACALGGAVLVWLLIVGPSMVEPWRCRSYWVRVRESLIMLLSMAIVVALGIILCRGIIPVRGDL